MCFAIILSRTDLWNGRYDSGDKKRQKNVCCWEVYFSNSSNYNVHGSDCVCELYCILYNLRAERILNAHICIRRIPIFAVQFDITAGIFCYTRTKMYSSHCCKHIDVSDIQYDKKHNDVIYHIYWSDCIWIILQWIYLQ